MPGVTEQEIAQAKQMNLYQYMQLCEPDNFKPEGPGQFRHKGHSSLTFAEDGSWTYFKTKATGRTALNYLIAVEGVSFVEAVREINRIQGGVRPSFQPVKAPSPPAEKKPAKEFRLPKPDKNNYAATAYLRKRCIHPNVLTVCKQKRILYQTSFKDHPNCVFVGRDGNGEAKGGSLRGCSQIQFRRDIPGSKKDISVLHRSCCHCRHGGSVRSTHRCHVRRITQNHTAHRKLARCSLSGAGRYGLRCTGCVSYILPEHNAHCSVS